jgi:hypothetical protein
VEGLGEDVEDLHIDLADDGEQVTSGGFEILQLGGQELVALLERGELLQRQWVDLAEQGEITLGALRPAGLPGSVVARRLRSADLLPALKGCFVLGYLDRGRRHWCGGPVLGDQVIQADTEVIGNLGLELLDAQPLLSTQQLVTMHRVGELVQLPDELANPGPDLHETLFPL